MAKNKVLKKKDAIQKAIDKAAKKDLKRKARPPKSDLPDLTEAGVTRCLELLKEVEKNNGHIGIARILVGDGHVMTGADVREIDEARAAKLAELEASEPVEG
jgi:hypothetical protein